MLPQDLGDPAFCADHGLEFPYVAGAMANGIGSVEIVEAMARAGMLGFFGAAGLSIGRIQAAVERLQQSVGDLPHGFNLIHSPGEPDLENAVVDLYIRRGVRLVEASAYLDLTPPLVRYRTHGVRRGARASDPRPDNPPPDSRRAGPAVVVEGARERAIRCRSGSATGRSTRSPTPSDVDRQSG